MNILLEDIIKTGEISDVLHHMLATTKSDIQRNLIKIKNKVLPPDYLDEFLEIFITEEGTKRPIRYTKANKEYILTSTAIKKLPKQVPNDTLHFIINSLETEHILKPYDEYLELEHDILAEIIDTDKSEYRENLYLHLDLIDNYYSTFKEKKEYLSLSTLTQIDSFGDDLLSRLDEKKLNFLTQSKLFHKNKRRKAIVSYISIAATVSILFTSGVIFLISEFDRRNQRSTFLNLAETAGADLEFKTIFAYLESANMLSRGSSEKSSVKELKNNWTLISGLRADADSLKENEKYRQAAEVLSEAYEIKNITKLKNDEEVLRSQLKRRVYDFIKNGQDYSERGDSINAAKYFNMALEEDPGNLDADQGLSNLQKKSN